MERVFSNLVGNALEMMPEGGRIQISAAAQNGFVAADVRDAGPGIAPEIRGSLFEPFVSAGTRNGLGVGAGALAADGAGPRRQHVGGIGAGRGRVLPGAAAGGGVQRGA